MAISITLTLPDEIFNLAQSLAHSINRDLNDIWFFVTWYGSIGWHKSTKSLSGKRLN
ncbi:hypothetical protein MiAbB_01072 [Microcystis aeruginosa NIES-4285]|uniref:Uncharacterized protein n=1 Tax=Microcystis aeruginosa NIES-4285 TaxID=2497681 RepID=A0A402DAG1_MICAE|nr:hypothetical protein MiAbB_01072 [Microcystis aeruginosa NIES-4285]